MVPPTMQSIYTVLIVVLEGFVVVANAREKIPSQQPTIVPEGGRFEGSVQGGIAILSNDDRSTTKLYYTISSCCDCDAWKRPDPDNAGIDKDTRELKSISERVHLTSSSCVSSVAVTEGQSPSNHVKAMFFITETLVKPPTIKPNRGKYLGRALITMETEGIQKGEIYYTVDGGEPTDQSDKYRGPFNLTAHGKHYIRAVTISGGMKSPVSERQIEIALPVKYQVVTDGCEKCKGATVGVPFVLLFQGFRPSPVNKVFVSPLECRNGIHHMLAGCDCRDGVMPTNLTLKMTTNDSPTDRVYVCYTRNGGQTWSVIRNAATNEFWFPLHAPLDAEGKHIDSGAARNEEETGNLIEEATPQDWDAYFKAQKRKQRPDSTDAITPGVVVLVILGTGLWFAFRRA